MTNITKRCWRYLPKQKYAFSVTKTLFFPSSHLILISPSLYRLQQNDPSLAWLSWTLAQKRDLDFAFYPWPVWLKTQSTGLMPSLLCIPTWHILRCFYSKTIKDPELLLSFQFWTALALWPYQPNRLAWVRVTTAVTPPPSQTTCLAFGDLS